LDYFWKRIDIMSGVLAALIGSFKKMFSNSWSQGNTATSLVYNDATYADLSGGKYFAFGSNDTGGPTTTYNYSSDGTSWSSGTLPISYRWGAAAFNGTNLVVFPSGIAVAGPSVAYTTDGTTWTTTSLPFTGTNYRVQKSIWDGTRFLCVTNDTGGNGLLHSTTGTSSWSGIDVGTGGYSIDYDGSSRYIVSNATNSSFGRTTTSDPTVAANWSGITFPSSGFWSSIVYGNGIWVAFRAGTDVYATSTNGTTWTSRTLLSLFSEATSQLWGKGVFYQNKFYYYYTDIVYSSDDGISWTPEESFSASSLDQITGWAAGPDKIVGVGNNSTTAGTTVTLIGE
jgi:hypothetical protein